MGVASAQVSARLRFDEYLDQRFTERRSEPAQRAEDAPAHALLALQRSAGNHAVSRLLQRMPFAKFVTTTGARKNEFTHEVGKGDLHKFLLECGQEKRWVEARLRPLEDYWVGLFTSYGGGWSYEGPANTKAADPPQLSDILRTLDEAASGRLKAGVIDYAGENQRHGGYKWCTQSFVQKHVLDDNRFKSPQKQGKARIAGSPNITANSVIAARQMSQFQDEIARRQDEFAAAYERATETAQATGTVNRGLDFHTNERFDVLTYESALDDAFRASGQIRFAVVKIGEDYLVNHFGGVIAPH